MKSISLGLIVLAVIVSLSCDKPQSGNSSSNSSNSNSAEQSTAEKLPEQQVIDIVNATAAGETDKVKSLLQSNPKLINAKFTSGGPVDGWPLIMIAARHNHKPLVDLLIASGAKVNDENYSSETALHYASAYGHKDIVETLLKNKADPNVKNDADATPLSLANGSDKPNKQEIIELLRKNGAKE